MTITFQEEYLQNLYETGKTTSKKHRYQPEIIRAYAKCIYRMEEAATPEDLYRYRSLNFEALHGDKKGLFSIRVNDKYRIEFEIHQHTEDSENAKIKITVCNIIELSNHYK